NPLAAAGVSVRIGVTTTDNGNPRCPKADTTPEAGALVASSCIERAALGDFKYNGTDPPLDVTSVCTDFCERTSGMLGITQPWIEFEGATANLADGVTVADALKCVLPQGISGCGFESQLESMYKAIARADTEGDPSFGFLRELAILGVVVVTDE